MIGMFISSHPTRLSVNLIVCLSVDMHGVTMANMSTSMRGSKVLQRLHFSYLN